MRRLFAVAAVALVGTLATAPAAFAPPASGVPNVSVARTCVVYGSRIPLSGFGFAPGTSVTLSAPLGHYIGPRSHTDIAGRTLTADATGGFRAAVRAPAGPADRWSYHPRVVFADGIGQTSGVAGQSFTEVLVASRAVCHSLDHPPRRHRASRDGHAAFSGR